MDTLQSNILSVNSRIMQAVTRSEKTGKTRLVAVTKGVSADVVNLALKAGVRTIAENRVQEAKEKFPLLETHAEKHMIGNLQRNKAKKAVEIFDCIQSLDSIKLAEEIDKQAGALGKRMPVFLQVNISGEKTKHGFSPDQIGSVLSSASDMKNLLCRGLMTIAPLVEPEETRQYFRKMKSIFDSSGLDFLSMGMTNDFEVAIEEGSNMVRIGRAIFG